MDDSHHLPLSLAGVQTGGSAALAARDACPGICTPQDWSPLWIGAMPMSSIEGIVTSSIDLTT
jgi:hypothetical protein